MRLRQPFLGLAGGWLVAAAGFLSAALCALARRRAGSVDAETAASAASNPKAWPRYVAWLRRPATAVRKAATSPDWLGEWLPVGGALLLSLLGFWAAIKAWQFVGLYPKGVPAAWMGGGLLLAAFPILVLERRLSASPAPEAGPLARLGRLLILILVGSAAVCGLRWQGVRGYEPIEQGVALFTALVAAEIFLRTASYLFLPLPPLEARFGFGGSLLAGLIRFERPSLQSLSASVSRHFGIDLARSWALGFIRRAAFPLLLALCVGGWLLTGLTALGLNERAVYEAWGQPRAVFGPGLHAHWPWPFGRLRPVEYGVVREIPIVFDEGDGIDPDEEGDTAAPATIEGPAPEDADRLWDASHPSEASYLVASNRNGQEDFEVVNIDLRIVYRIGLGDQAAYDAVYHIDAPDNLIRAAAGRMLARYFAGYTLFGVLGQDREKFIQGFQRELQERLDSLSSGIDILSVVVEAIHPPPEAAPAYQNVQAAAIRSLTDVAIAAGEASRLRQNAEASATALNDNALAGAEEIVAQAKVATQMFAADVSAHRQYGDAYLFERRLTAVGKSLGHDQTIPLTVVDHRIPPAGMPTLDLRPPGSPGYPALVTPPSGGN